MGLRHVVVCGLLSLQYFFTLFHKGTIFEAMLLNIKFIFRISPQHLSETFFILRSNERNMIRMCFGLDVKYTLILDFNENLIFRTDFLKKFNYQISRKSFQWEPSCSLWMDGRTDRHDEANDRFSQFCELA